MNQWRTEGGGRRCGPPRAALLGGIAALLMEDQTSQILRYVKLDGTKVQVTKSFIDFLETEGKKAKDMVKMILDKIESDGLDIQNCRGQAYDNAAVMSGRHSGVQMRIKAVNKNAQFVACSNHSLNLVGVHAASIAVDSVTFLVLWRGFSITFHLLLIAGRLLPSLQVKVSSALLKHDGVLGMKP